MMQLYDITIAANTTRQLDAPGSYFYYYSGSAGGADSSITLRGLSSGLRIILKPGQAFRLPAGTSETSWVITNYANTATIIGSVIVGDGDITDNRVTGSVEVIDGGKNRTMANIAFSGYGYANPVAGQTGALQLWNPVGSGKRAIIERLTNGLADGTVPSFMQLGITTTALASLVRNAANKHAGGSVSTMQVRTETTSVNVPNVLFEQYAYIIKQMLPELRWAEPIVLEPGYGLTITNSTTNSGFNSNFEFYEESI